MKLHFFTFWAINAPMDERTMRDQLDQMRKWGFDGVVFHPRFYPGKPPYLSDEYFAILRPIVLHARDLGLDFWIYDENGWPSGTVGGELLQRYPEDRQQWADLVLGPVEEKICAFQRDGKRWSVVRRTGDGVDYLRPSLARHFLEMTYERYRVGLGDAFEHVSTFFCDEPEFGLGHAYDHLSPHGAIPWTENLPREFARRYGQDLNEILPLLFFPGGGHGPARVKFYELLTDLFCQSFLSPLNQWCRNKGKRFTAHVKGEEHPLFQVPMVGSCHQVFQHLSLPGIDALERYPSGEFFPRQVASAARQFGNGDCMAECFGGAGWGATPEELEKYLLWLQGHGINYFVLHLNQYRLTSHAIRDWPASLPAHVTWRDAFPELLRRVRRHAEADLPQADTLVVAPYRGIMEEYAPGELPGFNIHNASTYPDTAAGRINRNFLQRLDRIQSGGQAYHVCDERTLEKHGRVHDGQFHIGRCAYQFVTADPAARLSYETHRLLAPFTPPPERLASETIVVPTPAEIAIQWQVQPGTENQLVLEAEADGMNRWLATFDSEAAIPIQLCFADDVEDVELNGASIELDTKAACQIGRNKIRFTRRADGPVPFLSVRGRFAVLSRGPYRDGPKETLATEGLFFLTEPTPARANDLVQSGYPFCGQPISIHGTVECSEPVDAFSLCDVAAAGARVRVDGVDWLWCWGPDWKVSLPKSIDPGRHEIEVELIPSSFNTYGPHHHIDGDLSVVSPAQYDYVKNFADRPDAPMNTRTRAWHFKPLGIGPRISFK